MSTRLTNELGRAILKALKIPEEWATTVTLTSRVGKPETVSVTFHAWDADTSEMTTTTRTWIEVVNEEPAR